MTPLTEGLTPLPAEAADGECDVSATVSAPSTDNPQNPFTATLSYTSSRGDGVAQSQSVADHE